MEKKLQQRQIISHFSHQKGQTEKETGSESETESEKVREKHV